MMLNSFLSVEMQNLIDPPKLKKKVDNPFHLPIEYLDESTVHSVSPIVLNDLELTIPTENPTPCMYEYAMNPKNKFEKDRMKEWSQQITSNTQFLTETQDVIRNTANLSCVVPYKEVDTQNIMKIWKDLKEDDDFLDKYSYMEWSYLDFLNTNSTFLQGISVVNMISPVMSFIVPFMFLLFPFIILKIQNIPITFSVYLDVLKGLARNHFIGKALINLENMTLESLFYLVIGFGFYLLQIYQNVTLCMRFYNNIQKINTQLNDIRQFTEYSVASMRKFVELNNGITTYRPFCQEVAKQCDYLEEIVGKLKYIQPFQPSLYKIAEIGYLLKCYYELHSYMEYERALLYSFSYNGYIENIGAIYRNIQKGVLSFATFTEDENVCNIKGQYYPALLRQNGNCDDVVMTTDIVKNDTSFSKNMIITGPNASGKTTLLKTATINIILTQQFGCGFYKSCLMKPYTHIHSYLNIPDTSGRDSLFQAESRRCKEIIDIIRSTDVNGSRHFCIFDELYSGTNPLEATKSAYAFLKYLSGFGNVNFILTTHYVDICKRVHAYDKNKIRNYKMEVVDDCKYTYKLLRGISHVQGAIKILKDMDYPDDILQIIKNY